MSVMFLDIASVPGFELGARLYGLHDLSDKDIARVMSTKNREKGRNSDELGQHQLQVAAISVLLQDDDGIKLQTSGGPRTDELHHLQFLTSIIDQHKPEIITWDRRTILPVLNYRCLAHGCQTPFARVAEVIDLKSELSGSEYQDSVSLHAYLEGAHELIRINLELNVIKACMIHQRWKLVCGEVDQSGLEKELQKLKKYLLQQDQTHLTNFIDALI